MKRHRSTFDPKNTAPYELSRSRIENYVRCPACFYLQQVKAVPFPSIPGFNINEATDVLLKRDFDKYRGCPETHPFLKKIGMEHLVPFEHEDFEKWTQSMHFGAEGRMNTVHEESNIKLGGGLDDVWFNRKTNELHIVDYKSTSQKSPNKEITLNDYWKAGYKRQMDMYVWIMRRKGFSISSIGYFLYCDGDRFSDYDFLQTENASMQFKMSLIPYQVDTRWIKNTLIDIRACLTSDIIPNHSETCEFGTFLDAIENF